MEFDAIESDAAMLQQYASLLVSTVDTAYDRDDASARADSRSPIARVRTCTNISWIVAPTQWLK